LRNALVVTGADHPESAAFTAEQVLRPQESAFALVKQQLGYGGRHHHLGDASVQDRTSVTAPQIGDEVSHTLVYLAGPTQLILTRVAVAVASRWSPNAPVICPPSTLVVVGPCVVTRVVGACKNERANARCEQ